MSRRTWLITGAAGVAVVAAGVALLTVAPRSASTPTSTTTYASATVKRQTLSVSTSLDGTLGYGPAAAIPVAAEGLVTWLPSNGTVITQGQVLERVDNRPVVLMYGTTPAYRAMSQSSAPDSDAATSAAHLAAGRRRTSQPAPAPPLAPPMTGPDVQQLEDDLTSLGYSGFTADGMFTAATADAVKAWQSDLGLDPTGEVQLGDIVFLPGPIRVVTDPTALGTDKVGSAVKATSTDKIVTASAPVGSSGWAHPGVHVTVTLPNQRTAPGTVTSVGAPASSAAGPVVPIRVALTTPTGQNGDVSVTYVSRTAKHALTVPVTALVALEEGGYGVQLSDGNYVPVKPGLYADGLVQITGDVTAGTRVRDAP